MEQKNETVKDLFEQLHSLLIRERCYYDFKRICEKMELLIRKLHDQETDPVKKSQYLNAAAGLSHTSGKEVYYIQYHQDLMHRKNAAKIRAKEYFDAVNKAYDQVYLDIFMILKEEENNNSK